MAKHTRDSWGSLQYDAKKRKARIRYWAEGADGYKRRSKTIRNCTRKEAEAARAALMLEHGEDAPCPTVQQAWERYALPYYQKKVDEGSYSAHTLNIHKSRWRVHIEPRWGNAYCDTITPLAMQQWFDKLAYRTAIDCNKILRRLFKLVSKYHQNVRNIMLEGYDMPHRSKVNGHDNDPWSPDELMDIWDACRDTWLEASILLRGYAGCRPGESLAVKSNDVQVVMKSPVIVASIVLDDQILGHGYGKVSTMKNDQSERITLIAGMPAERLIHLAENAQGYVTNDGMGNWVKQERFNKAFYSKIKSNGIARHPIKNMRKTWETAIRWQMGLPPWISEPLMGHKMPGVTAQYYDRPTIRMMAEKYAEGYMRYPFGEKKI